MKEVNGFCIWQTTGTLMLETMEYGELGGQTVPGQHIKYARSVDVAVLLILEHTI
jgi:hypothetical protein